MKRHIIQTGIIFSFITAVLLLIHHASAQKDAARNVDVKQWTATATQHLAHAQGIADTLRQTTWWDQPAKADDLESLINTAGTLRSEQAIPVLIEHLAYHPWMLIGREETSPRNLEMQYPAVAALVQIGMPSVPHLLKVLKELPGAGQKADALSQRQNLAASAIRKIHDKGGAGLDMARQRIKLEIASSTPEEKRQLTKALNHVMLRNED